jgi:hypothetical protein
MTSQWRIIDSSTQACPLKFKLLRTREIVPLEPLPKRQIVRDRKTGKLRIVMRKF